MKPLILPFESIGMQDLPQVGGKNASLGEMTSHLGTSGIRIPPGFAITAEAFQRFLQENNLNQSLINLLNTLNRPSYSNLREIGEKARLLMKSGHLPTELKMELLSSYGALIPGDQEPSVAVRSSATAEDLPHASFAGQHESFLNIAGQDALLQAVIDCYASLYTDRAIKYREDNGFAHDKVLLSVGIQKMIRADLACSGVGFTLEPESGFRDVIHLAGVWGLGENMVQGTVTPDEFLIYKPSVRTDLDPVIQKTLGSKDQTMVYDPKQGAHATINTPTPHSRQIQFVLQAEEIRQLATWGLIIENHYGKAMDFEWAKDGTDGKLYMLQARPETVKSRENPYKQEQYVLSQKGPILCQGEAIGMKVTSGIARKLNSPDQQDLLKPGEILVTDETSPDWDPILKKAGGIVTNKGGRTSHASIVAREEGVPAVVGCGNATDSIEDGASITVSCSEGKLGTVYAGSLEFNKQDVDFSQVRQPERVKAKFILGDPEQAFRLSFYPNDGVGLMRMEFIIAHTIQIHPLALIFPDRIKDKNVKQTIAQLTQGYTDHKSYFIEKLAEGLSMTAAAFYPKEVIVRLSDFKSNEYAKLLGGEDFEPKEENPMLGLRGASRYYHPAFSDAFGLECEAIQRARTSKGFNNIKIMVPFCRTLDEGEKVLEALANHGLVQGEDDLEVYVMAEIPSNILLAEEFSRLFDGFSIGSNDLTQLTLGIDRDSAYLQELFNEMNPAVEILISNLIQAAGKAGKVVGLCGQGPSDNPDFTRFLVRQGINSISFNPDAMLRGLQLIVEAEQEWPSTWNAVEVKHV